MRVRAHIHQRVLCHCLHLNAIGKKKEKLTKMVCILDYVLNAVFTVLLLQQWTLCVHTVKVDTFTQCCDSNRVRASEKITLCILVYSETTMPIISFAIRNIGVCNVFFVCLNCIYTMHMIAKFNLFSVVFFSFLYLLSHSLSISGGFSSFYYRKSKINK